MASSEFILSYGMLLIASWINGPLFAYEFSQVCQYFRDYKSDNLANQVAVYLSLLVDTVAVVSIMVTTWYYLVSCWGDAVSLTQPPIAVSVYMMSTALSAVISQSFLTRRIYLLTKQLVWPIVLGLFMVTGLASALGAAIIVASLDNPTYSQNMTWIINFWFCSSAVTDALITLMMIYALSSLKKRTNSAHITPSPLTTNPTPVLLCNPTPSPRSSLPAKPSSVFSNFRHHIQPACGRALGRAVDRTNTATLGPQHLSGAEDIDHAGSIINPIGGSERLIKRLSIRAAQTGICTAIIAGAAVICFNTMKNNLATMFGMLLGRIHVITILYNLNSRRPASNLTGGAQSFRDVRPTRNDLSVQQSELTSRNRPRSFGMDQDMPSGRSERPSKECMTDEDDLDFGVFPEERRGPAPDTSFLQITPPPPNRRASEPHIMYYPSVPNLTFDNDGSFRPSFHRSISTDSTMIDGSPIAMSSKQLKSERSSDTLQISDMNDHFPKF